jgi:YidC/Oxa1 family membrane protein insertase
MAQFFYISIYQPLFNLLIFLYNTASFFDLGIAVILLTLIIKTILYPLGIKAARSQKEMEEIQPEVKKIQEKYKTDKEKQAKKIMELYKERKVNPFSGMLPLFIQLPILISLFQIFRRGLETEEMKHLYAFVNPPEVVNYTFLGIIDLSSPNIVLAIVAAVGQYLQMKMISVKKKDGEKQDAAKAIQSQMILFLPGFTFIILLSMPSVIGLYWVITVAFSIFQQYIIKKEYKGKKDGGNKKNN